MLWATAGAAQVPPDERWRSLETTHFCVIFPADLEALARRAGERAERADDLLSERFVDPPGDRIELLLTTRYRGCMLMIPRYFVVLKTNLHISNALVGPSKTPFFNNMRGMCAHLLPTLSDGEV
jgi:hypothetical protein